MSIVSVSQDCGLLMTCPTAQRFKSVLYFATVAEALVSPYSFLSPQSKPIVSSLSNVRSGYASDNNDVISFAFADRGPLPKYSSSAFIESAALLNCQTAQVKTFQNAKRVGNIAEDIFVFIAEKGKIFFRKVNF
jgi:hypothetical protein